MQRKFFHRFVSCAVTFAAAAAVAGTLAPPSSAWAEVPRRSIRVDETHEAEPISPYIYGQFIEHLGRCIYGGLWAEMLEDRKFYYPVTGEAPAWDWHRPGPASWEGEGHPYEILVRSPWMIFGPKDRVTMDREHAFVGEHAPRVRLVGDGTPGGIYQERLGLERGRRYTGRIVLAGDPTAAPVDVSLVWGGGANDKATVTISDLTSEFRTFPLEFVVGARTDNGRLEITSRGSGSFLVGTVSLMPADNILGWRRDVVELLKQLNAPVYRWPGGNFVSGYNWKDGIGPRDRRPPRKNPAWLGVESNDVGIHEFIDLCREIGAEPYVAVNTGLGDANLAAEQVEYCNGGPDTPMGRLRAQNGHPQPFNVKFWAIGNEMYGDWQLGHMPLERYQEKHRAVVDAMRAVDPDIVAVGVGALGPWSRGMLENCASHMELISEHLYWQDREDLLAHVRQIVDGIRRVAEAHREYRRQIPGLADKDIRIALDEWNYWYGANEYGELGVRYFLQDALGIAAGLHELFRNSDLFYMANYAQTVNVIGAIKTDKFHAEMEPTGLVLALYRQRFGTVPVQVSGDFDPLDIAAAWNEERTHLTLAVVNPTEQEQRLAVSFAEARPTGKAAIWTLTGPDRWAGNRPGLPRQVDVSLASTDALNCGDLRIPPLAVVLYDVEVVR
ncbi:MAG: hypothetical protein Kow00109_19840 [Acidobacteriota bacterium]